MAGGAWPADIRARFGARLEALGRPDADAPERVPPDALAEGSPGHGGARDGGVLLRRRGGAPARLHAARGTPALRPQARRLAAMPSRRAAPASPASEVVSAG